MRGKRKAANRMDKKDWESLLKRNTGFSNLLNNEDAEKDAYYKYIKRKWYGLSGEERNTFCGTKIKFTAWFIKKFLKQKGNCYYCGLAGDITRYYSGIIRSDTNYFVKGNRKYCAKRLEIDKKNPNGSYKPRNCVLACYPCNNAKSNVFTADEFKCLGAIIRCLKDKEKKGKMKNNKFIKGLQNKVKQARTN